MSNESIHYIVRIDEKTNKKYIDIIVNGVVVKTIDADDIEEDTYKEMIDNDENVVISFG